MAITLKSTRKSPASKLKKKPAGPAKATRAPPRGPPRLWASKPHWTLLSRQERCWTTWPRPGHSWPSPVPRARSNCHVQTSPQADAADPDLFAALG